MSHFVIAALYKFAPLDEAATMRQPLLDTCRAARVTGTLILAREGINGTIAGSRQGIDRVLAHIRQLPGCAHVMPRESRSRRDPFLRLKVRLKREIVTMGIDDIDPLEQTGIHVAPHDWNDLIRDRDVVLIDARNTYETQIGSFRRALDPCTESFRDFPGWFSANRHRFAGKKIAMYCTGGIRCEKATAFAQRQQGDDVYQLKGGILGYLETVPLQESLWEGACFVFDRRVSVGHGLLPGDHSMCHACRWPITVAERQSRAYVPGVSCPHCHGTHSVQQMQRFAERQRQSVLARERGGRHLGSCV